MHFDAMTLYRAGRKAQALGIPLVPKILRRLNLYLHHAWIPERARIGEGTVLGYGGLGVVIHEAAQIGRHCLISQQVTIGGRSGRPGAPVIGDYVRIGAGARVLGNIRIGDFAVIGANAVVVHDVADAAVVAGVPARELRRERDPIQAYLREHSQSALAS
ncbi:MAG: serine acetyltransferase [Myxococcaceae bacterium]|nr:serine acetyltransferase [Myxococcaceae bacterium]